MKNILRKHIKETTIKKIVPKKSKNMNLNRLLGEKNSIMIILGIIDFFIYFIITYLANFLTNFSKVFQTIGESENYLSLYRGLWYTGPGKIKYYFFFFVVLGLLDIYLYYKFTVSFSEKYFNINQKGKARWTTVEEIKQQYKVVPEMDESYPGLSGTIVAHFDGNIYLDTNINNNLYIGMTRSGKDEMFVYSIIDICSRAEIQPSVIVFDPKMETYKSSKKTVEKRGYDTYLLNLDDPLHSMGINPLALVIKFFKQEDPATAYSLARTFSYSIFHAKESDKGEAIWKNTATDLFTALIIAVTQDLLKLDEALNEMRLQSYNIKREAFSNLTAEKQVELRKKIKEKREQGIDIVTDRKIKAIPEDVAFEYVNKHEKQITIYNIIILFTELVRKKDPNNPSISKLDTFFNRRAITDLAKLKYATVESAAERTKGSIYTNMLSYLGVFIDENIAKMTAESSLDLEDIGFGKKPIAIFIGVPDYDKSNHFIASVFIRQIYFILAKKATNARNQKTKRPVRFVCNECGNMPPIEAMSEIVTVSNGRGIGFDLFFQGYSQIFEKYGDDAQTIIDNCANKIYIKSDDNETLEKISKDLGTETYIDVQRTGNKLSINKTYMETPSDKPLLRADELSALKEGECVVMRKLKRKDLEGNDIVPTPIFNNKETGTAFPYRYMYLTETFPDPDTISLSSINPESREHIDLQERVINIDELLHGIDNQIGMMPEITVYRKIKNFKLIDQKLKEIIGDDYLEVLDIPRNASLAIVLSKIEETSLLQESTKLAIRSLVA